MSTLSVLKFESPTGAESALATLQSLQKQQLITIQDAAIVTWAEGKSKPKTKQLHNMAGLGALDGAFWGMLFGLIFFVPLFFVLIRQLFKSRQTSATVDESAAAITPPPLQGADV